MFTIEKHTGEVPNARVGKSKTPETIATEAALVSRERSAVTFSKTEDAEKFLTKLRVIAGRLNMGVSAGIDGTTVIFEGRDKRGPKAGAVTVPADRVEVTLTDSTGDGVTVVDRRKPTTRGKK